MVVFDAAVAAGSGESLVALGLLALYPLCRAMAKHIPPT